MNLYKCNALIEATQQVLGVLGTDPEAGIRLESYNFGSAKRQVGQQRLTSLLDYLEVRATHEEERWALSQQIKAGLKAVRQQFRTHAQIARIALKDEPEARYALRIDPVAKQSWDMVNQAVYFYRQLQQKNLGLEKFGFPRRDIEPSLAAATALLDQKQQRTHRKGQAESGTQQIQQAQASLRDWLMEFRGIARVAYRHDPQRLEMFGMSVPSSVTGKPTAESSRDFVIDGPAVPGTMN